MLGSKGLLTPLIPDCSALRALTILKNIRNPLIFMRKMASYSCFWRVPRLKIFMQASLHQISNLLTLVSCHFVKQVRTPPVRPADGLVGCVDESFVLGEDCRSVGRRAYLVEATQRFHVREIRYAFNVRFKRIAEDLISACRKHVVAATGPSPFKVGDNQRPQAGGRAISLALSLSSRR